LSALAKSGDATITAALFSCFEKADSDAQLKSAAMKTVATLAKKGYTEAMAAPLPYLDDSNAKKRSGQLVGEATLREQRKMTVKHLQEKASRDRHQVPRRKVPTLYPKRVEYWVLTIDDVKKYAQPVPLKYSNGCYRIHSRSSTPRLCTRPVGDEKTSLQRGTERGHCSSGSSFAVH
jgi:hypothetical protein